MKGLVILGSGTGGTIMATLMRQKLPESKWEITIIDQDWQHHYQPGWIFISSGRGWGGPGTHPGPGADEVKKQRPGGPGKRLVH